MSALEEFARISATHERCFWLDGGGSQSWSGSRSIVGRLEDEDVSLVYDRAAGTVVEHPSGRVVGDDVFDVLQAQLDGDPDTHWVGYFGYAARPDLPARPMPGVPDAIWMRARDVQVLEGPATAVGVRVEADDTGVPDWYAAGFRQVQEELRAGNSYEVNLTYRDRQGSQRDALEIYTSLRTTNPAPYAGVLRHGDVWLLSASPERFATVDRHRQLQ
ncbi:MAG: chorismate-binding protein, partial [Marmoricola sp.]